MFKFNYCGLISFILVVLVCSFIVGCPPEGGSTNTEGEGEGEGEPAVTEGEGESGVNEGWGEGEISEGEGEQSDKPFDTETIMLPGEVPLEMVLIPAGTFLMGAYDGEQDSDTDEKPQHQVTLSKGFWMGKYELTKAQWEAVMSATPWSGHNYVLDHPDSPAVYVSWNDVQSFIAALNALTGKTFRLPTEAEREYACRAGATTRFYWGDDPSYTVGNDYAWWYYNAWNVDERYAHVVGQKLPNAWGLYDMSGNVSEWCDDWWYRVYTMEPVTDPTGPDSGSHRILRGGGWYSDDYDCRSAFRTDYNPSYTYSGIGFRLTR